MSTFRHIPIVLIIVLWISPHNLSAQTTTAPAEWPAEAFDYKRPTELKVDKVKERPHRRVAGTRQEIMTFENINGEKVPVLITKPRRGKKPFPVVVLAHGFTSNKVQVTRQLGRALTDRGFACVALDFPMHGDRKGKAEELFRTGTLKKKYLNIVGAIVDLRQTIDFAQQDEDLDTSKGVGLIGYSMGSWFSTLTAAADKRVKALVLMVGGSAVETDDDSGHEKRSDLLDKFIAISPAAAIQNYAPRPLLMQNGKNDRLVPKEKAKALFNSAKSPKEHRWYNAGHLLPTKAYEEAAKWLEKQMDKLKRMQKF